MKRLERVRTSAPVTAKQKSETFDPQVNCAQKTPDTRLCLFLHPLLARHLAHPDRCRGGLFAGPPPRLPGYGDMGIRE